MYRVFEALDELGAIVEEARGVPMTAGCVVPRGDVLELIDDIKDAIPGELDDAQDVLDARDSLLSEAKEHSESMVSTATAEADSMVNHARGEADRLLADAKSQADRMVAEARQHSERMVGEAREEAGRIAATAKREYEASTGRAKAEADRLIENGNLVLREGRPGRHQGAAAAGVADRDRADRDRRGDPADRLCARRGRPAARRMRHLRRQQARRVRGLSSTEPCVRSAAAGTSCAPPRARTTTPALAAGAASATACGSFAGGVARRIAVMATHAKAAAHRGPRSPLVINISRLGRGPGR